MFSFGSELCFCGFSSFLILAFRCSAGGFFFSEVLISLLDFSVLSFHRRPGLRCVFFLGGDIWVGTGLVGAGIVFGDPL